MLKTIKNSIAFFLLMFFVSINASAQSSENLWSQTSDRSIEKNKQFKKIAQPRIHEDFRLNLNELKGKLAKAPKRKGVQLKSETIVKFPNGEGGFEDFRVVESSILNEKLQNEHANIKTYYGESVLNNKTTIRFSVTSMGFHGMLLKKGSNTVYIDPVDLSGNSYMVYARADNQAQEPFECKFDELAVNLKSNKEQVLSRAANSNDGKLRKFRLAVATTGEYSQFHINNQSVPVTASDFDKKSAVLSAVVTTINRVNSIYERDFGITLELVANNIDIIFLDAATDNLSNDNKDNKLLDESQVVIDNNIGFANYDIGHTFSTGAGGVATLNSPCTTVKAKGITGISIPIGDSFNVDYVCHEMGHQFGAHHTFNGDAGSCSGDNRNNGTAVEPGSGSTIMGYSGICAPQNVQNRSDDYFHLVSIKEVWSNITIGTGKCGALVTTNNVAPVITDLGNYTIPISTPFVLKAEATDANNDALTYCWEQLDAGVNQYPLVSTIKNGSVFRSLKPTVNNFRYFPDLETVNAGAIANKWEVVPSVGRTMRFGVTVRDNNTAGGQTSSKELNLIVDGNSGPFIVTSQNENTTWYAGTSQKVTWNVANTNVAPVACTLVSILLSNDGGLTYSTTLASKIPNNGSYDVIVPNSTFANGKIKIQSENNVFYALNKGVIKVETSEFILDLAEKSKTTCAPSTVEYDFTYKSFLSFSENVVFSATGFPEGAQVTFNPTSASATNTAVKMTVSNVKVDDVGSYSISIMGNSTSVEKSTTVALEVFSSIIEKPQLVAPLNNAENLLKPYKLEWKLDLNAPNSLVQVSTTTAFTEILETITTSNGVFEPKLLQPFTTYYWRVKSMNNCGESIYSDTYSFTTINETCNFVSSVDIPKRIPDGSSAGIQSIIPITDNKKIVDIKVTVNINHKWMEDLSLYLISPKGTIVTLSDRVGNDGRGFDNTVFDDEASTQIQFGTPLFTGSFKPQGKLSDFENENSIGNWALKVVDISSEDLGTLTGWGIEICGNPIELELPADNFSVNVNSESCVDKNNGEISINAVSSLSYEATINGVKYDFNGNTLKVNNLAPGTYNICVNVVGQTFKYCYVAVVEEASTVQAKTEQRGANVLITVEKGTAPFDVFVNNQLQFQSSSSNFDIELKEGDLLQVKTSLECEGVYTEVVSYGNQVLAYPNPTSDIFEIEAPFSAKQVKVEIYNTLSQLVHSELCTVNFGKLKISVGNKPKGVYIAKVYLEKPISIKIIKK